MHCCIFLNVCEMYCIEISSIVFSSVDVFNLKFKKQSEKLKHYEGENIVKITNEAIIYVFILTFHF